MPIVRDAHVNLEIEEVLRQSGIKDHSRVKPQLKTTIDELLSSIDNSHLLEPAIIYEIYPVTGTSRHQLSLPNNVVLHGSAFTSVLGEAKELAVAFCTIGPNLEIKAADYFEKGEPLRGLLLDSIGSATIDALRIEACQLIAHEASLRGYQASSPISPGRPSFPISEQRQLFGMVSAQEIGITLAPSGLMIPRKSISMVVGLGLQMKTWTRTESCASCTLNRTCAYRIHL